MTGELKLHGLHACEAVWRNRPEAIIRVYVTEERLRAFGPLLKWCADRKKAYHVVTPDEMERIVESVHHEGVTILARERVPSSDDDFAAKLATLGERCCLLWLDGVQNPHNIGSILRVAAHFGSSHVLGRAGELPKLSPSACRVAEGGAEHVELVALARPKPMLATLRKSGFTLLGTSSHQGVPLYDFSLPAKSVVIVGAEVGGMSQELQDEADELLTIPGTGRIESLNVAAATALLLGEHWRQHHATR